MWMRPAGPLLYWLPEGIMKLWIQIPNVADHKELAQDTSQYSDMATFDWPEDASLEAHSMTRLTLAGCKSVPVGNCITVHYQDSTCWVPGGLIIAMCMQKVPGLDLSRVYNEYKLPIFERMRIRQAFKEAILDFGSYGFYHIDPRPNNVIWDSAADKCYIIDFESMWETSDGGKGDWYSDTIWRQWGLVDHELDRALLEAFHTRYGIHC